MMPGTRVRLSVFRRPTALAPGDVTCRAALRRWMERATEAPDRRGEEDPRCRSGTSRLLYPGSTTLRPPSDALRGCLWPMRGTLTPRRDRHLVGNMEHPLASRSSARPSKRRESLVLDHAHLRSRKAVACYRPVGMRPRRPAILGGESALRDRGRSGMPVRRSYAITKETSRDVVLLALVTELVTGCWLVHTLPTITDKLPTQGLRDDILTADFTGTSTCP
jgi:hypothetical protein